MMTRLPLIAGQFTEALIDITPLGNGLINDTFLVTTANAPFVLQRINSRVFANPGQITDNLLTLNRHLEQKSGASIKLQIPKLLNTTTGTPCYCDESGDYWRALSFIADTESLESIAGIDDARQAGFALGHFHRLVSDLDPLSLHDTLPGFHIAPDYLSRYHDVSGRVSAPPSSKDSRYCAGFIASLEHIADDLESAKQQGLLPLRIIHGDPKLNNFLFAKSSKKAVSLIDLDTVKPGLVHYDIGDCLRSCCHILETDEFDLAVCAALLESYLAEAGAFFSEHDYCHLYPAIRLIPFELGLRFYTDYLEGNRYFKVTEPEQNLQRAVRQFRLCASIIAREPAIQALIDRLKTGA